MKHIRGQNIMSQELQRVLESRSFPLRLGVGIAMKILMVQFAAAMIGDPSGTAGRNEIAAMMRISKKIPKLNPKRPPLKFELGMTLIALKKRYAPNLSPTSTSLVEAGNLRHDSPALRSAPGLFLPLSNAVAMQGHIRVLRASRTTAGRHGPL